WGVRRWAARVPRHPQPVAPDNPFVKVEREMSERIEQALDQYRDVRDEMYERMFKGIYESPLLAAAVGIEPGSLGRRGPQSATWEQDELKRPNRQEVEAQSEQGTLLDAGARLHLSGRPDEGPGQQR